MAAASHCHAPELTPPRGPAVPSKSAAATQLSGSSRALLSPKPQGLQEAQAELAQLQAAMRHRGGDSLVLPAMHSLHSTQVGFGDGTTASLGASPLAPRTDASSSLGMRSEESEDFGRRSVLKLKMAVASGARMWLLCSAVSLVSFTVPLRVVAVSILDGALG
jgi:hypothetical protein